MSSVQPGLATRLSLKANFSWTLAGNLIYAGCQWGILVVLAKLGAPELVGQFALGLAITGPIFLFASLKLRAVQATDANGEFTFGNYLALRIITIALAMVIVGVVLLLGGYSLEIAAVIFMIGLSKSFDALSDMLYGLLQQHEQMDRVAISRIFQGVAQLLAVGVIMTLKANLFFAVAAMALASALVTIAYDICSAALTQGLGSAVGIIKNLGAANTLLRPCWDRRVVVRLMWRTLPLGVTIALGSLWLNLPRYFIQYSFSERELGIFAALGYLTVAGSTVIGALGQAASPRLAQLYVAGRRAEFFRLTLKLVAMGGLLGIGSLAVIVVAGQEIITLIYRSEYANHIHVLVWMMGAYALQSAYVFFGTAMSAMRNFIAQLPIQLVSCVIVTVLCYVLVKPYGLFGAAWAMLGATIFEAFAFTITAVYVCHFSNTTKKFVGV